MGHPPIPPRTDDITPSSETDATRAASGTDASRIHTINTEVALLRVTQDEGGTMSKTEIRNALRPLIVSYGFYQVERCLREMEPSDHRHEMSARHSRNDRSLPRDGAEKKPERKNTKPIAAEYVAKMDLPPKKRTMVTELAERFEHKSLLPIFMDIGDFCRMYGIDAPASRSRTNAIPRVFKRMAAMQVDDPRRILDSNMFSGPSRLGPIADAIRRSGRHGTATRSSAAQTSGPASSQSGTEVGGLHNPH